MFVYMYEDFAINCICPKFLRLLLTGKVRIGVTERGGLKNIHKQRMCQFTLLDAINHSHLVTSKIIGAYVLIYKFKYGFCPMYTIGLPVVCDCGISWSYSIAFRSYI